MAEQGGRSAGNSADIQQVRVPHPSGLQPSCLVPQGIQETCDTKEATGPPGERTPSVTAAAAAVAGDISLGPGFKVSAGTGKVGVEVLRPVLREPEWGSRGWSKQQSLFRSLHLNVGDPGGAAEAWKLRLAEHCIPSPRCPARWPLAVTSDRPAGQWSSCGWKQASTA